MDSASLRVPIEKTVFQSVFGILCGWRHKWGCFACFCSCFLALDANPKSLF